MYKLHYNRVTKKMFDINKRDSKHFANIEINEDQKNEILSELNKGLDCFVDIDTDSYYFSNK